MCAIWLALMASAAAIPADAGEAALRFLEKVRTRTLDLEPGRDTALAQETSDGKRQVISRRLERIADDLTGDPLVVSKVQVDGDYAAALVRKTGGFDPSQMRVMAVALVRRGGQWLAAPVPASFENTGSGYAKGIRHRLASLQDWMLREQVLDLQRLREETAERLRRQISQSLPAESLRMMTALEVAERFVEACGRRDLPLLLGLLGGLSNPPPDDWALRLKSASAAVAGDEVGRDWLLLMSGEVLRAVVHHEQDGGEALVSIGCLDPVGTPGRSLARPVELVHLPLAKSPDGLWRVELPHGFHLNPDADEEAEGEGDDDSLDADLLEAFPAKLAQIHPPRPASDAHAAMTALLGCLTDGTPAELVRLLGPPGSPERAQEALTVAAQTWWMMRDPSAMRRPLTPVLREQGSAAIAVCQIFSARNPDRTDLRVFHFEKSAAGWSWSPVAPETTDPDLLQWADQESARLRDAWRDLMLAECQEVDRIPESGSPDEASARRVVEEWLAAIRAGDVDQALRLTARLRRPDSPETVLRNLGYEICGNPKYSSELTIISTRRSGPWTAVGTRGIIDSKPVSPLYPVIQTAAGPRILLEIDLIEAPGRSRDFLNKTALARLDEHPPGVAADLRKLLEQHKQDAQANPSE